MQSNELVKPLAWLHRRSKDSWHLYAGADKLIAHLKRSRILGWLSVKALKEELPVGYPAFFQAAARKGELLPTAYQEKTAIKASKVAAGTDYAFLVAKPMEAPESLDPEDLYRAAKFLRDTGRAWPHATHITLRAPRPGNKWDPFVLCLREARSGMLLAGASILPPWARKPED